MKDKSFAYVLFALSIKRFVLIALFFVAMYVCSSENKIGFEIESPHIFSFFIIWLISILFSLSKFCQKYRAQVLYSRVFFLALIALLSLWSFWLSGQIFLDAILNTVSVVIVILCIFALAARINIYRKIGMLFVTLIFLMITIFVCPTKTMSERLREECLQLKKKELIILAEEGLPSSYLKFLSDSVNLKVLRLNKTKDMGDLISILKCMPNLETLYLTDMDLSKKNYVWLRPNQKLEIKTSFVVNRRS